MNQALKNLRAAMKENGVDIYLIFNTDPHLSEYIAEDFMTIKKLTGFSGDNAFVIVTQKKAVLFTDSRYEISGRKELKDSDFKLILEQSKTEDEIKYFIDENCSNGYKLAFDGKYANAETIINLKKKLNTDNIIPNLDLTKSFWQDRPQPKLTEMFVLDTKFCGQNVFRKTKDISDKLKGKRIDMYIISKLDEIAWLLNLRAADVEFCPVFRAFAVISKQGDITLFINKNRLTDNIKQYLKTENIEVFDYEDIYDYLAEYRKGWTVGLDISQNSYKIYSSINSNYKIENFKSPITKLKSIKNTTELDNLRQTMVEDGVALEKFFYKFEKAIAEGKNLTELEAAKMLLQEREKRNNFISESFGCISAFNANAAMPHYAPTPESDIKITPDGIYLVDSGGQYFSGTTDITRVIPTGKFSDQFKRDYTLVFKGMADLATTIFPQGITGGNLDTIARKSMWKYGRNFGHGTGHGVGFCLNVHEGPQSFSPKNNVELKKGMVITDEPGIYIENEYGIRIENMLTVTSCKYKDFLKFEVLTLCHIDLKAIDTELLTTEEIDFINNYHKTVYKKLSPHLLPEEKDWLKEKCKAI